MTGNAVVSPCGLYRYRLSRRWGDGIPLLFVMLNPSRADAEVDDPTIRKCLRFAHVVGRSGIEVVNLFAYRATDPRKLRAVTDPVGPANDAHIVGAAHACGRTAVVAWGRVVREEQRARAMVVTYMLRRIDCELLCLKANGDGSPAHPLYLHGDIAARPWRGLSEAA